MPIRKMSNVVQLTHRACHGRASHGSAVISSWSHHWRYSWCHASSRNRTTYAVVSPRSDTGHPHRSTSGAICSHQSRHVHQVHRSSRPTKQLRSLRLRHETLCRSDHLRFNLLHPLALLLGIGAAANECLLHLFRLLKVDIHFSENVLRRILNILENALQLCRVFLVEQLAFLRHCIFRLRGEGVLGGFDEVVVSVDAGTVLGRGGIELVIRHEIFVGARLGRRCHVNAALIRGAAPHGAIIVAVAAVLVIV
mmetsp:Transcript_7052/g.15290  ORF Transcript_7052/g.15290 Transcript_7052/m.15290 type:complete len:252 (-) Transcript_7052:228-983(-)